ncbi:hypothetical protein B0H13DRAFT_1502238, partial [Mycena leptocephala]
PKWMIEGYALLCDCDGGREWEEAVVKWTELERAYGLVHSVNDAAAKARKTGRGRDLGEGGRSTSRMPPISLPQFSMDWWKWWANMAPSWRQRDEAGRPILGGHSPWGVLVKPGGNGMLTPLLCLGWWQQTEGKATDDWLAAVQDVKWV